MNPRLPPSPTEPTENAELPGVFSNLREMCDRYSVILAGAARVQQVAGGFTINAIAPFAGEVDLILRDNKTLPELEVLRTAREQLKRGLANLGFDLMGTERVRLYTTFFRAVQNTVSRFFDSAEVPAPDKVKQEGEVLQTLPEDPAAPEEGVKLDAVLAEVAGLRARVSQLEAGATTATATALPFTAVEPAPTLGPVVPPKPKTVPLERADLPEELKWVNRLQDVFNELVSTPVVEALPPEVGAEFSAVALIYGDVENKGSLHLVAINEVEKKARNLLLYLLNLSNFLLFDPRIRPVVRKIQSLQIAPPLEGERKHAEKETFKRIADKYQRAELGNSMNKGIPRALKSTLPPYSCFGAEGGDVVLICEPQMAESALMNGSLFETNPPIRVISLRLQGKLMNDIYKVLSVEAQDPGYSAARRIFIERMLNPTQLDALERQKGLLMAIYTPLVHSRLAVENGAAGFLKRELQANHIVPRPEELSFAPDTYRESKRDGRKIKFSNYGSDLVNHTLEGGQVVTRDEGFRNFVSVCERYGVDFRNDSTANTQPFGKHQFELRFLVQAALETRGGTVVQKPMWVEFTTDQITPDMIAFAKEKQFGKRIMPKERS